jgi:hypothetical protein
MAVSTKSKNRVVDDIFKDFDKFTGKPEVFLGYGHVLLTSMIADMLTL